MAVKHKGGHLPPTVKVLQGFVRWTKRELLQSRRFGGSELSSYENDIR
jgi:hypothetical protein